MAKGEVYKNYYPIDEDIRKELVKPETTEDVDKYFEFLAKCHKYHVCSECWTPVEFNDTWLPDEIREFGFSALCKECQRKLFGI